MEESDVVVYPDSDERVVFVGTAPGRPPEEFDCFPLGDAITWGERE
jgi:hypothetical protein